MDFVSVGRGDVGLRLDGFRARSPERIPPGTRLSVEWEGNAGMDRESGAAEAVRFVEANGLRTVEAAAHGRRFQER